MRSLWKCWQGYSYRPNVLVSEATPKQKSVGLRARISIIDQTKIEIEQRDGGETTSKLLELNNYNIQLQRGSQRC